MPKRNDNKIKVVELFAGYVRGGCSPIGMKKKFPTYIEESAAGFEKITVSAGVKGAQLLLKVEDLLKFTEAKLCQIV